MAEETPQWRPVPRHIREAEKRKSCPTCANAIPAKAKKCTHCGEWTTIRRNFSVNNTTLVLITALISVLVTSYPIVKHTLPPWKAVLNVSYIPYYERVGRENIRYILAENQGNRSAVISDLYIWFDLKNRKSKEGSPNSAWLHYRPEASSVTIIKPGEQKILKFKTNFEDMHRKDLKSLENLALDALMSPKLHCGMEYQYIEYGHSNSGNVDTDMDCAAMSFNIYEALPEKEAKAERSG